jgi:hypothetical protein
MNTKALILGQFDTMRKQLEAVLEGFPEDAVGRRFPTINLTPLEAVEHLCDTYSAYLSVDRRSYRWGSYRLSNSDWESVLTEFWSVRGQAREAVRSSNDDAFVALAFDYVMAHDAYHVGQLAACRMACDPEWDPESLYK